jgi:hypothetical protein
MQYASSACVSMSRVLERRRQKRTHKTDVKGVLVRFAIHRNGADPELPRGSDHTARDLAAGHPHERMPGARTAATHRFAMRILLKCGLRAAGVVACRRAPARARVRCAMGSGAEDGCALVENCRLVLASVPHGPCVIVADAARATAWPGAASACRVTETRLSERLVADFVATSISSETTPACAQWGRRATVYSRACRRDVRR